MMVVSGLYRKLSEQEVGAPKHLVPVEYQLSVVCQAFTALLASRHHPTQHTLV